MPYLRSAYHYLHAHAWTSKSKLVVDARPAQGGCGNANPVLHTSHAVAGVAANELAELSIRGTECADNLPACGSTIGYWSCNVLGSSEILGAAEIAHVLGMRDGGIVPFTGRGRTQNQEQQATMCASVPAH